MAVRPGPQTPPIYNGFAEMTVPWSGGSAVQSWKMNDINDLKMVHNSTYLQQQTDSKDTLLFDGEYLRKSTRYRHSNNGILSFL